MSTQGALPSTAPPTIPRSGGRKSPLVLHCRLQLPGRLHQAFQFIQIAETGSLVFHSSPETPTLHSFLPLHHIAVVEAARILRYPEDYWAAARAASNRPPRNVNWVTGTSGTADIEAKNIRGAHGPRFLHILIVGDEA